MPTRLKRHGNVESIVARRVVDAAEQKDPQPELLLFA
jgi:hypothetical protein